jgi:hypothetical protein
MPKRSVSILVMLVTLVAGCGGDEGDESEAPTKAEWIASANVICAEMFEELDLIPEPQTPEEMGEAGPRVTEIHRTALARLRALVPPDGEEGRVEQILDAAQATIDWGEEFTDAVAAGDDERATELLAEGERLVSESDRLFGDYGILECLESEE